MASINEDSGDLRAVLRGPGEIVRLGAPPYRSRFTTFLALRRVHRQGRFLTLGKMVVLIVGYLVALLVTMILTLALTLATI